jgi:hypothetical protein
MRDPLLTALTRERYGANQWWVTTDHPMVDNDLACGKRRRALSEALDAYDDAEEVA